MTWLFSQGPHPDAVSDEHTGNVHDQETWLIAAHQLFVS